MPDTAACADLQLLERFAIGDLPDAEADALAQHVLLCPSCVARLDTLSGADGLTLSLAGASVPGVPSAEVQRLIDELRTRRPARPGETTLDFSSPEEVSIAEPALSAGKLDFLASAQAGDELGRLGAYRVLKVLGKGGMGMVFLAEDTKLERRVALKVMLPRFAENPTAKQRFLREAKSAAALKHDHIITIYQVDEDRGVPFLAMEYLEGQSLDQRLKTGQPPSVQESVRIGRDVAQGLAAAHARGLIHRDVKPGNIWLETIADLRLQVADSSEGRRDANLQSEICNLQFRVKLLDFGLARAQADDVHVTQSGAIVGTPAYMAPEQARGEKNVDQRADLFSLGCVLYRLCAGTLPFPGQNTMAILMALATHTPPVPAALNPEIPGDLSELTMRLLDKDPSRRPASATEVVALLGKIEQRLAPPVPVPAPPRSAAETAIAPAPIKFDSEERPAAATQKPTIPPSAPSRRFAARRWLVAAGLLLVLATLGYFFAGTVVRFISNRGELIVDIDDPSIEVTIKGEDVIVHDRDRQRRYVLTPGKDYEIEVREWGEDGIRLATRNFTIVRGGKERLSARMLLGDAETTSDPERRAAFWVLRHGGKVKVRLADGGAEKVVTSNAAVPRERFTIREVDLAAGTAPVAELDRLQGLNDLAILNLGSMELAPGYLPELTGLPAVREIVLAGDGPSFIYLATQLHQLQTEVRLRLVYLKGVPEPGTEADRKAAEWALAQGGSVEVESNDYLAAIKPGSALPEDKFRLRAIRFDAPAMAEGILFPKVNDASLVILKDVQHLRWLVLHNTSVSDAGVKQLSGYAGLAGLEALDLGYLQNISSACVPSLLRFKQLSRLNFRNTKIDDAGVKLLVGLPKLREVQIGASPVTNAGLAELAKLRLQALWLVGNQNIKADSFTLLARFRDLEVLDLRRIKSMRDENMAVIAGMPRLRRLYFEGSPVGNGVLKYLDKFPLTLLQLSGTSIDDDGLAELSRMPSLKELLVARTRIGDAGLAHLTHLKTLRQLRIKQTQATAAGIARLHAALPRCRIESDHGTFGPGVSNSPPSGLQLPPYTSPSKHALIFDGKSNYVSFPTVRYDDSQPLTIEMDVKPAREQVTDLMTNGAAGFIWDARRGPPMFSFGIMTQDKDFFGLNAMTGTVPHEVVHLAGVLEPDEIRIYLNGKLQEAKGFGGKKIARPQAPLTLGANDWLARSKPGSTSDTQSGLNFFAGRVQRIRISRVARYKQNFTPGDRFVPDKDTLALYQFDEGQGDKLIDSSGNGHHGKIVGAKWVKVTTDGDMQPARPAACLQFDGKSSYVEIPSLRFDAEQPVTIEGLVTVEQEQNAMLLCRVAGKSWMSLSASGKQWSLVGGHNNQQHGVAAPNALVKAAKTHVATTWDGKQLRLFINGKEASDRVTLPQKPATIKSGQTGTTQIGGAPGSKLFLAGKIHGLRVSRVARDPKGFTPATRFEADKDTIALYRFDEGQGDRLIDSSGNNHHGRIVGAQWVKGTP